MGRGKVKVTVFTSCFPYSVLCASVILESCVKEVSDVSCAAKFDIKVSCDEREM
jgi:hypothetical protein